MPSSTPIFCLVVTSMSISLSAMLSTNVIVVAPSGGNYTEIQPAIDAAANGDTILVKAGSYAGFAIVGRERLDVVADAGANVQIHGNVRIRNCDGPIVVSGLAVNAPHSQYTVQQPGLALTNNPGSVRVMSCTFQSADSLGAQVLGSADVELAGCSFHGGGVNWNVSGAGIWIDHSSVALYDDNLVGVNGGAFDCGYIGADGASGLRVSNQSLVFASRCSIHGGTGTTVPWGTDAGNGGPGVTLYGAAMHVRDSDVQGGPGGVQDHSFGWCNCWCCSCANDGNPGQPYVTYAGATLDPIVGPGRTLSIANVVREQQALALQVGGVPGDQVILALSLAPGFTWQPASSGVFLETLSPTPRYVRLGTIGTSGMLNATLPIADLGPGNLARTFYLQTLHHDAQGNVNLGSGRALVVLDSSL